MGYATGATSPHQILGPQHEQTGTSGPIRGAMILAQLNSANEPVWDILQHPGAAGYALIPGADDIAWDQTPVWTGDHTWDDGAGDSPALVFVGGTGDDTAKSYLDDDAIAGNSDLVIRLVADDADAQLQIANNSGVVQAWIDATGDALFEDVTTDDHSITTGHGIIHADGVADGQVLVANGTRYIPGNLSDITGGDAQFVTMALSATLANERVLTAGNGIALADGGAGGNATLAVDLVAAWSGLEFSGGDLRVDQDALFVWTALHTFTATPAIEIDVASGDPVIVFDTAGADRFTLGVDDSDSDKFKINSGAALADPSDFELDSSGNLEIAGSFYLGGDYIYHLADPDTYIQFTNPDQMLIYVGNQLMLNFIEGVSDYIALGSGVDVYMNGNQLRIDTDDDTYLHASADDVISLAIAGNEQYDWDATEMTFSKTDGTEILWIRAHGDVQATGADIYGNTQLGLAADTDVHVFVDADNSGTGNFFAINTDAETVAAATELMRVTDNPIMYLNRTADNAYMSIGFTANQGTNDDEIASFWSDDVGHGITDYANTKAFGQVHKNSAAYGGMRLRGLRETSSATAAWGALALTGYLGEAANTTKTTAGHGVVQINAAVKSGTGIANVGADGNLVSIENNGTTRYLFDAEGSAHADVEWTTFDDHDDVALLDRLEAAFGEFAEGHQAELEALGIARFDDKPGHAMVNWTRLAMLLTGAVRQLAERVTVTEQRLLR